MRTISNPADNYCYQTIKQGDIWLIYSSVTASEIFIDECSRSRNRDKVKELAIPPPPAKDGSEKSQKEYQRAMSQYVNSDKGDIKEELKQLRAMKANAR